MPNGKQYPTNSELEKKLVEGLLVASIELPVSSEEFIKDMYTYQLSSGEITLKTAQHRFYQVLNQVHKKLRSLDISIENSQKNGRGKVGTYYLNFFSESSPELTIIETSQQLLESLETVPVEEAPVEYSPLEDKKRTDNETRTLKLVVDTLVSSGSENVWLERIVNISRKQLISKGEYKVVQKAREIRELIASSYKKLREEYGNPLLVKLWTQDDWDLWANLQILNTRFKTRDDQHLIQKLQGRIKKAEQDLLTEIRQIEEYIAPGK